MNGPDFIALAGLAATGRRPAQIVTAGPWASCPALSSLRQPPGGLNHERRNQTHPVLAALARIEASMAVFTTELATVITRLELLQSSLDAIREDLDREKS